MFTGVGRGEAMGQTKTFAPSIGFLKVFDFKKSEYDDGMMRDAYGPYEIYAESGELIRRVGEMWHEPRTIRLNHGKYLVRGMRENNEMVEFFVIIEGGKWTEVYSESSSDLSNRKLLCGLKALICNL